MGASVLARVEKHWSALEAGTDRMLAAEMRAMDRAVEAHGAQQAVLNRAAELAELGRGELAVLAAVLLHRLSEAGRDGGAA